MPARSAASTFSLTPPMGSTSPRRLTSPVIATSLRTGRSVISEASATNIATPALGPSLGMAPAGTCTWMSLFSKSSGAMPSSAERALTSVSAVCALSFITSPSWPGQDQLAVARRAARLDEQHVAADGRPRETGGHAGQARAHRDFVLEPRRPQDRGEVGRVDAYAASAPPSATCIAARRNTLPIARSRLRTPASRV